ncbi:MAG: hypothetical protein ACRC2R_09560 [Xenococcaceae cyanobacterium]
MNIDSCFKRSTIVQVILCLLFSLTIASPANASFCRQVGDRNLCILSIKRSAKNYWEYRATVSVNGVKRPIEVYNCRDRLVIKQDKMTVRFKPNDAGELICKMFQK